MKDRGEDMATRAKGKTEEELEQEVQDLNSTRFEYVVLTGTYDMLMHNPASMFADYGGLKQKVIPKPAEEAAASRYITEDGLLYVPTQGVVSSIGKGGRGRRIEKMAANSVLKSSVFAGEERSVLYNPVSGMPLRAEEYTIFTTRVVIKGQGGVLRSRARISLPWAVKACIEVDNRINNKLLIDCGRMAGRMVGLLDWRPERSGPFGRYTISLVE